MNMAEETKRCSPIGSTFEVLVVQHAFGRCLTGKDSDAGRDWGQEENRTTEDEMAG